MHNIVVAGILSLLLAVAAVPVAAQVAGSTTIGVAPDEVKTLARGWSAKKQILDKAVYNDQDERVGEVEDLIITPDKAPFVKAVSGLVQEEGKRLGVEKTIAFILDSQKNF